MCGLFVVVVLGVFFGQKNCDQSLYVITFVIISDYLLFLGKFYLMKYWTKSVGGFCFVLFFIFYFLNVGVFMNIESFSFPDKLSQFTL